MESVQLKAEIDLKSIYGLKSATPFKIHLTELSYLTLVFNVCLSLSSHFLCLSHSSVSSHFLGLSHQNSMAPLSHFNRVSPSLSVALHSLNPDCASTDLSTSTLALYLSLPSLPTFLTQTHKQKQRKNSI